MRTSHTPIYGYTTNSQGDQLRLLICYVKKAEKSTGLLQATLALRRYTIKNESDNVYLHECYFDLLFSVF